MQRQYRGSSFLKNQEKEIKIDYYLISENKVFYSEEKPRCTYGIEVVEDGSESELIQDISINKNVAIDMIEKLKEHGVLPVHLHDIVEDLL